MFGVKLSFVATRSGLLRWVDHLPVNKDANNTYDECFSFDWSFLKFLFVTVRTLEMKTPKRLICLGINERLTRIKLIQKVLYLVSRSILGTVLQ